MRHTILAITMLLSGCSFILDDSTGGEPPNGPDADSDGALLTGDGGTDAQPAECNRFLDVGCDSDQTCNAESLCIPDTGIDPAGTACASDGQCEGGLGCDTVCRQYCDDSFPFPCMNPDYPTCIGGFCYEDPL